MNQILAATGVLTVLLLALVIVAIVARPPATNDLTSQEEFISKELGLSAPEVRKILQPLNGAPFLYRGDGGDHILVESKGVLMTLDRSTT